MFIFQQLANVSWSYLVRTGVLRSNSKEGYILDYRSFFCSEYMHFSDLLTQTIVVCEEPIHKINSFSFFSLPSYFSKQQLYTA